MNEMGHSKAVNLWLNLLNDLANKLTDTTKTTEPNHGNLRDDRPSHGRDVRASTDGLAACRRVNAMARLDTCG
jgi:hypothetical protein